MRKKMSLPMMAIAAGVLLSSLAVRAAGELLVLPISTRLLHGHDQTIKVRNEGDAPLYLQVALAQVSNPGMTPERKVMLRNLPQPGMLATPEKLVLGPNQSREIHLTSLSEPQQEALYRLYITPTTAFSVTNPPREKIAAPMSFSVGYGVLVRHMPAEEAQKTGWRWRCEGQQIALTNTGNVRLRLSEITLMPGGRKLENAVGLFPGMPQRFKANAMTLNVDAEPATVTCP